MLIFIFSIGRKFKLEAKKFYKANYLMDYEAIVSAYYPKMVETKGKEKMLLDTEKHYENDEFRLRFQLETVPFQYGKIIKKQDQSFCVISCRHPLRYFFETKLTAVTAAEKTTWLKQINKTNKVTFEPKRNSFNVRRTLTYIAVIDETTANQWKFLNFDDVNQYEIFKSLFGENNLKELGL